MKKILSGVITSLPIWAGLVVIVLSFVLWHAQRSENNNEIHSTVLMQGKHVTETLVRSVRADEFKTDKTRFEDLLGGDHFFGFSMVVAEKGRVLYQKGKVDKRLKQKWALHMPVYTREGLWRLTIWPNQKFLVERKTYLPDLALFMGLIVAVLLVMVGLLAILASQREQAIHEAHWRLRRETREKEKLQKVLQQNQKLQAVGTLAGGIAHDFNNILYAMMGYVAMAQEDVDEGGLVHRNLGKVLEAGKRGKKLIASILSFSRQQQYNDMGPMDLVDMLRHVFELLGPAIPASITIVKQIALEHAEIHGDPAALEQVMVNIINNAVDAMDGCGTIEISLEKARFRPAYCISIVDHGSGMTEETRQRLFDPFFTTKSVDKGTGLGLSMAHGIISDHQGKIRVESELGKGSTFAIYLPFPANEGE